MTTTTIESDAPAVGGVPFAIASRPQRRFSNTQTVSNVSGGSFQVVQLPATGWVRRLSLFFEFAGTCASAGALVTGDGPWNLITGITLTDATGQPVIQPVSGFNAYLVRKFGANGAASNFPSPWGNPVLSPEYAYTATSTTGTARFRIDLDFEIDARTGYGCIPNLDSNASLQVKIDYAPHTVAWNGTGVSAANLSVRMSQEYWAPIGSSIGGVSVDSQPPGVGDYLETRYETQTVSALSENLVNLTNRGGLIKNVFLVSRNAGARVAFSPGQNFGIILDNQPIYEGVRIEEHNDFVRRAYGYHGADSATYPPLTAGVTSGLDTGVIVIPFSAMSGGRDSWLSTRAGSLLQVKITPGSAATTLEVVTQLVMVKNSGTFYDAQAS